MNDPTLHAVLHPEAVHRMLPLFDGFPYLVVRVMRALRGIILLPASWSRDEERLLDIARRQARVNDLDVAVVRSADRAAFFPAGGTTCRFGGAPTGGILVADRLHPVVPVEPDDELAERRERLEAWLHAHGMKSGYVIGDIGTTGREATAEELRRLRGRNLLSLPRGLSPCRRCLAIRGACLGPSPRYAGLVLPVHCLCDNHNRCGRCGRPLSDRKLNGNRYAWLGGGILHTPGFRAFSHRCPDEMEEAS